MCYRFTVTLCGQWGRVPLLQFSQLEWVSALQLQGTAMSPLHQQKSKICALSEVLSKCIIELEKRLNAFLVKFSTSFK